MDYDAIIIGGGPGGSTAGCVLAQAGQRVLILERERFPRFHIGESLIPYGNEELRAIGVWPRLEQGGFMPKFGAEFVTGNSAASTRVLFGRHLHPDYAQTFQVERSRFDQLLLEQAARSGCEVWQETAVGSASVAEEGVRIRCTRGGGPRELTARWLLDASGRDAFLGRQLQLPRTDFGLPKKLATFAHFAGVRRNDPPAEGHITIVRLAFGWFWMIPLDAEKTSVGLVRTLEHFRASGRTPGDFFDEVVATTPELQRRMGRATRMGDFHVTGDYTYRHLRNAGPRWLLLGDAAGFIDPIFSSGVMLAIKSGHLAAREVLAADRAGTPLTARTQARYTREVGRMCTVFLNMIRMFDDNRSFEVFLSRCPIPGIEAAVNHLVAGDTRLAWHLRARVWIFYAICALQRRVPLVPRLTLSHPPARTAGTSA